MKALLIPLIIILTPILLLFIILRYLNNTNGASLMLKISLGVVFIAIGIMATIFAMIMSVNALSEKGVTCMTGIAVFVPISFAVNIVGIPLLLIFYKSAAKNISG